MAEAEFEVNRRTLRSSAPNRYPFDVVGPGFLAGRAPWGDLVGSSRQNRPHLLDTAVRSGVAKLGAIATEYGAAGASRYDLMSFGVTGYREV